jgi:hypothetical protein
MEGMTEMDMPTSKRYTVPEAAKVLGIGTDAVRKRIARDTIPHEKDDDGRVYVYLDTGHDEGHDTQEKAPMMIWPFAWLPPTGGPTASKRAPAACG